MTSLEEAVRQIGVSVAGPAADDVDRHARFPIEALTALKKARLLSAFVPKELGGMGCGISELSGMCELLGRYCSASGMVLAMHHIQVACLVRHGLSQESGRRYLAELAERQLLIASVTSEVGVGGDTRTSVCALERTGGLFALTKDATTISYGEHADDLLITARRASDAQGNDQLLVLARKGEYTLQRKGNWDTLGMRGTCSPGFLLTCSGSVDQILPTPFAEISSQTMVPFSHILWAGLWLGIATAGVTRARAFVREQARRTPGVAPPSGVRLAELWSALQAMRSNVHAVATECDALMASSEGAEGLSSLRFALEMNNLKVIASTQVVQIIHQALLICGISGYKNDTKFSLGRQLRDAHSAALMVGNDRILATNASLLLVLKEE